MRSKLFTFIIIITFISLLGVVFTQVYWVRNAIGLKEEHFNHSVRIAMKTVLNRLIESNNDSTLRRLSMPSPCYMDKTNVQDVVKPKVLDSLIKAELGCMQISKGYEYAIYNRRNDKFVMGNFNKYVQQLLESEHQQTIQALFKPGDYYFTMYFPRQQSMIFGQMAKWMLISALFLLVVIFSFWFTIVTIIRQKKLSEMKTDFINNMTHEFKTPIATISLASEMLMKSEVNQSTEKIKKYASVIYNENFRLQNQVEQVLQIAILDNGETKMRMKEVDIHKLITKTVDNFEIKANEKSARLTMNLRAENPIIAGDRMHLSNVLANLIDNALKYSRENPQIELSTVSDKKGVTIAIIDNGIGIATENQHLVFKNLYRVHTGDVHDVKGFGLGLYYVKQIVEMHHGSITLTSQLGQGSTFDVFLPYNTIQTEA
jgi:two-component system phosphate regulon sensor histidine kinase PhoR